MSLSFKIGDTVKVHQKNATVAFIGETEFATGEWIGVILDTPDGKNDGSVNEVKYFDCDPLHGLFVRATQVRTARKTRISGDRKPTTRATTRSAAAATAKYDQAPVVKPDHEGTTAKSDQRKTAKSDQVRATKPNTPANERTIVLEESTADTAFGEKPLVQQAETPQVPLEKSTDDKIKIIQDDSNASSNTPEIVLPNDDKSDTPNEAEETVTESLDNAETNIDAVSEKPQSNMTQSIRPSNIIRPKVRSTRSANAPKRTEIAKPKPRQSGLSKPSTIGVSKSTKQTDVKVKELEKDLEDSSNKIKALEQEITSLTANLESEKGTVVELYSKLSQQDKKHVASSEQLEKRLAESETQFSEMRKELKQVKLQLEQKNNAQVAKEGAMLNKLERENKKLVEQLEELQDNFENLTLDKELAEENYETTLLDFENMKHELERIQLEKETLRNTNKLDGAGGDDTSWREENEKLREALVRLHTESKRNETEMQQQSIILEKCKKESTTLATELQTVQEKFQKMETVNEELLERVEIAEAFESMVEALSEKNMDLSEQVEDLSKIAKEVQTYKEELEIAEQYEQEHEEYISQLRRDLESKDTMINNLKVEASNLSQDINNRDLVIEKLRELTSAQEHDLSITRQELESMSDTNIVSREVNNPTTMVDTSHYTNRIAQMKQEISVLEFEKENTVLLMNSEQVKYSWLSNALFGLGIESFSKELNAPYLVWHAHAQIRLLLGTQLFDFWANVREELVVPEFSSIHIKIFKTLIQLYVGLSKVICIFRTATGESFSHACTSMYVNCQEICSNLSNLCQMLSSGKQSFHQLNQHEIQGVAQALSESVDRINQPAHEDSDSITLEEDEKYVRDILYAEMCIVRVETLSFSSLLRHALRTLTHEISDDVSMSDKAEEFAHSITVVDAEVLNLAKSTAEPRLKRLDAVILLDSNFLGGKKDEIKNLLEKSRTVVELLENSISQFKAIAETSNALQSFLETDASNGNVAIQEFKSFIHCDVNNLESSISSIWKPVHDMMHKYDASTILDDNELMMEKWQNETYNSHGMLAVVDQLSEQLKNAFNLEAELASLKAVLRKRVMEVHSKDRKLETEASKLEMANARLKEMTSRVEGSEHTKEQIDRLEKELSVDRMKHEKAMDFAQTSIAEYEKQNEALRIELSKSQKEIGILKEEKSNRKSTAVDLSQSSHSLLVALRSSRRTARHATSNCLAKKLNKLKPLIAKARKTDIIHTEKFAKQSELVQILQLPRQVSQMQSTIKIVSLANKASSARDQYLTLVTKANSCQRDVNHVLQNNMESKQNSGGCKLGNIILNTTVPWSKPLGNRLNLSNEQALQFSKILMDCL